METPPTIRDTQLEEAEVEGTKWERSFSAQESKSNFPYNCEIIISARQVQMGTTGADSLKKTGAWNVFAFFGERFLTDGCIIIIFYNPDCLQLLSGHMSVVK